MHRNRSLRYFTLKVNNIGKFETSIRHKRPEIFNSMFREINSAFYEQQFCGLFLQKLFGGQQKQF